MKNRKVGPVGAAKKIISIFCSELPIFLNSPEITCSKFCNVVNCGKIQLNNNSFLFLLHLELHDNNIYIIDFLRISPSCNQTVKFLYKFLFFLKTISFFKKHHFLHRNFVTVEYKEGFIKVANHERVVCVCIYLATRFQGFKYCTGVLWKIHLPGREKK